MAKKKGKGKEKKQEGKITFSEAAKAASNDTSIETLEYVIGDDDNIGNFEGLVKIYNRQFKKEITLPDLITLNFNYTEYDENDDGYRNATRPSETTPLKRMDIVRIPNPKFSRFGGDALTGIALTQFRNKVQDIRAGGSRLDTTMRIDGAKDLYSLGGNNQILKDGIKFSNWNSFCTKTLLKLCYHPAWGGASLAEFIGKNADDVKAKMKGNEVTKLDPFPLFVMYLCSPIQGEEGHPLERLFESAKERAKERLKAFKDDSTVAYAELDREKQAMQSGLSKMKSSYAVATQSEDTSISWSDYVSFLDDRHKQIPVLESKLSSIASSAQDARLIIEGAKQPEMLAYRAIMLIHALVGVQMTGQSQIMDTVRELISGFMYNYKSTSKPLCMILQGPAGTGKTYVSKIISRAIKFSGILLGGNTSILSGSDFKGEFLGTSGPKTEKVLNRNLENVLVIDEAYTLSVKSEQGKWDQYGKEALDTMVNWLTQHEGHIVVIAIGYYEQMAEFMEVNEGLPRRFPFKITLDAPKAGEMYDNSFLPNFLNTIPDFQDGVYQLGLGVRDYIVSIIEGSRLAYDVGDAENPSDDDIRTHQFYLLFQANHGAVQNFSGAVIADVYGSWFPEYTGLREKKDAKGRQVFSTTYDITDVRRALYRYAQSFPTIKAFDDTKEAGQKYSPKQRAWLAFEELILNANETMVKSESMEKLSDIWNQVQSSCEFGTTKSPCGLSGFPCPLGCSLAEWPPPTRRSRRTSPAANGAAPP